MPPTTETTDAYIAGFPADVQERLEAVRAAIARGVPNGEESISYDMPTVSVGGRYVIYYAAWKQHVSLHAVTDLPADLEAEVAPLRSGRGTVKLRHRDPLPLDLVERVARHLAGRHRES